MNGAWSRRAVISGVTSLLFFRRVNAQEAELPDCDLSVTEGDTSYLVSARNFGDATTHSYNEWLSIKATESSLSLDGNELYHLPPALTVRSLGSGGRDEGLELVADHPFGQTDPDNEDSFTGSEFYAGRDHLSVAKLDGEDLSGFEEQGRSILFVLDDAFTSRLSNAGRFELVKILDGREIARAVYNPSGLEAKIRRMGELRQQHETTIAAAGGECERTSPCLLTTASVEMLGRRDSCFELEMMRRLRSAYPQDRAIVEDYVRTSRQLLQEEDGIALRTALLVFWLFVVLPTALLVLLGANAGARYHYLFGFGLLKRLFGKS